MCIMKIDNKDIIYIPNFISVSVFNTDIPVTKGRLRVKSSLKSMDKMQTVGFSTESYYHFHH